MQLFSILFGGLIASYSHAQSFFSQSHASNKKYENIRSFLRKIHKDYPMNTSIIQLGVSDSGIPIEGLKIGHGSTSHLLVSTHHGNEYVATEIALAAIKDFAENPIHDRSIYVIPVLNTQGYDKKNRYEKISNDSRVDPNRDYEGPCATESPWKLKSTQNLAQFIVEKNIVAAATLHTSGPAVVYPWGTSATNFVTPYDNTFIDLARAATFLSGYAIGSSGGTIFPADGTFEDYAFWKHGIWSLLFEAGSSSSPDQKEIDETIRVNVPGLRRMFENAPLARAVDHTFTAACLEKTQTDPRLANKK